MKVSIHFEFPLDDFWEDSDVDSLIFEALFTDAKCHLHATVLDDFLHVVATTSVESED